MSAVAARGEPAKEATRTRARVPRPPGMHASDVISQPGDPIEREADLLAAHALGAAPPCGACTTGRPCSKPACMARKARPGAARAPTTIVHDAIPAGGSPLPPTVRGDFEGRFDADFSSVRVHTGGEASRFADHYSARAYTIGHDIVFGEGQLAFDRSEGRTLLAHELAHVVQGSDGPTIRRNGGDEPATMTVDVCDVDVPSLTNAGLLREYHRALEYMRANVRCNDFWAHQHLFRRCAAERQRRVEAGEVWLGEDIREVPTNLYRIESALGAAIVRYDDSGTAAGPARTLTSPVISDAQLQRFLERNRIPTVQMEQILGNTDPSQIFAVWSALPEPARPELPSWLTGGAGGGPQWAGGGGFGSPMGSIFPMGPDPLMYDPFLTALRIAPGGGGVKSQGTIGEFAVQATHPLGSTLIDLNDLPQYRAQRTAPVFDWADPTGTTSVSVQTSTIADFDTAWSSTYSGHARDVLGVFGSSESRFGRSLRARGHAGLSTDRVDAIASGFLAINADHVVQARERVAANVSNPGNYEPYRDGGVYEAFLREGAITTSSGGSVATIADLDALQASNPVAFQAALDELGRRASARIISHSLSTRGVTALSAYAPLHHRLGPARFGQLATPDLVDVLRYGGGLRGSAESAWRRGEVGRGARGALAIGMSLEALNLITADQIDQRMLEESGVRLGLGTAGAAVEPIAARYISAGLSSSALRLAGRGVPVPGFSASWLRGGGGLFSAVGLNVGIEWGTMGFSRDAYPWQEYGARGTREAVGGAISFGAAAGATALTTFIITGAVAGSSVPVAGTIVGAVVGLLAYIGYRAFLGDAVEEWAREGLGEPEGCPRPPAPPPRPPPPAIPEARGGSGRRF